MEVKFCSYESVALSNLTHKDIYVFGGGSRGTDYITKLDRLGIKVAGILVDDAFFQADMQINAVPVYPLSYLCDRDENGYVIFYAVMHLGRWLRFREQGWPSCVFMIFDGMGLWDYSDNTEKILPEFEEAGELFADEMSRRTMRDFLRAKKTGDGTADIRNCVDGTYFNELTKLVLDLPGAYVDCGAFDGDSVQEYFDFVGEERETYAFEPDYENFKALQKRFADCSMTHCLNYGVWDKEEILHFISEHDQCSKLSSDGMTEVMCTSIDAVLQNKKVSFIKMDVEGAEAKALLGATNVIARDMPVLAISAYHRERDLIDLPRLLDSFGDGKRNYRIYLRHHGFVATELVLYAIPVIK